jgi:hypothetical protein
MLRLIAIATALLIPVTATHVQDNCTPVIDQAADDFTKCNDRLVALRDQIPDDGSGYEPVEWAHYGPDRGIGDAGAKLRCVEARDRCSTGVAPHLPFAIAVGMGSLGWRLCENG